MIHSKNYQKIKRYYQAGFWSLERVRSVAGLKTGVTAAEYKEITGQAYEPEEEGAVLDYSTMTKAELLEAAETAGIDVKSSMTKSELLALLESD